MQGHDLFLLETETETFSKCNYPCTIPGDLTLQSLEFTFVKLHVHIGANVVFERFSSLLKACQNIVTTVYSERFSHNRKHFHHTSRYCVESDTILESLQ